MSKRVERPTSAPNACINKKDMYMASRLTDAEIVVLYKHVGRRLVSMNDELPKDASDDVKYLANSMLTTAAENDARYIKRCNTNFKNRTGEDAADDAGGMDADKTPTIVGQSSDERPGNQSKSNENKSNENKESVPHQSIHLSAEGHPLDVEGVRELARKYHLEEFCDDDFAVDFIEQNRTNGWLDGEGKQIRYIGSWLKNKIIQRIQDDYNFILHQSIQVWESPKDGDIAKISDYARKLLPLVKALLNYGKYSVEETKRMEFNLKKFEQVLSQDKAAGR